MARYAFWQDQFWASVGCWFVARIHTFGSRSAATGVNAEVVPHHFEPSKVWVTVKNPPDLDEGDWDRVSLAKAAPAPGGFLLITDVKQGPKKVTWFLQG